MCVCGREEVVKLESPRVEGGEKQVGAVAEFSHTCSLTSAIYCAYLTLLHLVCHEEPVLPFEP